MKCAIYARFSTDNQNEESIDSQVAFCRDYIASEGWELLPDHIYTDYAVSGATDQRRNFQLCIENAKNKAFAAVVVFASSRFARDQYDELHYKRILDAAGVRLISASERFHDLDGVARVASEGSIRFANEIVRYQIKEHAARGLKYVTEKGYVATKPCYGYKKKYVPDPDGIIDKKTKKVKERLTFEVVEDQAAVVRRIFNLYLEGNGNKKIAQRLNEEGIPGPTGAKWSHTAIWEMLRRETYLGWIVRNKTSKKRGVDGKRKYVRNPREQWQIIKDAFPAIVDEEVFHKVQERIDKQADKWHASALRARENHSRYLLTGIIKCVECGKNFICRKTRNKKADKIYYNYACLGRHSMGAAGCPNTTVIARDQIESFVLKFCGTRMYDPEVVKDFLELANKLREAAQKEYLENHEVLEQELATLTRRRANLVDQLEECEPATAAVLKKRIDERTKQIDEIKQKLSVPNTIAKIFAAEAPAGSGTVLNLEGLSPSERQKAINRKAEEFEKLCQTGDVFTAKEKIRSMIESVSVTKDGSVLIRGNDKKILAEKNLLDLRSFTTELEEDITKAHPFSERESKILLSKDVYEDFCKYPLMKAMLDNLSQTVELKVLDEDEEVTADVVGLGEGLRKAHPPGEARDDIQHARRCL